MQAKQNTNDPCDNDITGRTTILTTVGCNFLLLIFAEMKRANFGGLKFGDLVKDVRWKEVNDDKTNW